MQLGGAGLASFRSLSIIVASFAAVFTSHHVLVSEHSPAGFCSMVANNQLVCWFLNFRKGKPAKNQNMLQYPLRKALLTPIKHQINLTTQHEVEDSS